MTVEKQAFEQGYKEGERIGKQMGERMVATAIQRYDRSVHELAAVHASLRDAMEKADPKEAERLRAALHDGEVAIVVTVALPSAASIPAVRQARSSARTT